MAVRIAKRMEDFIWPLDEIYSGQSRAASVYYLSKCIALKDGLFIYAPRVAD